MTSRDFAYWLQGFFEIQGVGPLTKEQAGMVQKHLSLVFVHEIDPSYPDQEKLNAIHAGAAPTVTASSLPKPSLSYPPGMRC